MLKTSRTQALLNSTSITRIARSTLIAVAGIVATASPALAVDDSALPTGGNVASGSADFNYHDNAPQLDINQHSDRVVIDWNSFDIGKNATTQFNQNSANAIAVNRVHDVNPSQILGALRANGKVVVLNTNGVFFGAGAKVDVSGLLVSTGELDAELFQGSGQVKLTNINANPNAKIENQGQITIRNSGLAAFVAPEVANSGIIEAHLGKIALASGADKATVDMYGDGLVELALDDKATKAVISNTGKLKADGGKIAITATAAKDVVDSVINMDGIVEANAVGVKNGVITLGATNADIKISGKISAQGGNGKITAKSNQNIRVTETADIDASAGEVGNGGTIDLIANKNMAFYGKVASRGGSISGNGGNVEISGYGSLGFNGVVDLSAANGNRGSLLLDPSFAIIHNGSIPAGWLQDYIISAQKLALTMANADVTVQADNFIDVGTKKGGYTNLGWTGIAFLDNAITVGLNALNDGPIDLSTWNFLWFSGTTNGNLTLDSNQVNFNRDLKMGNGNVIVDANTVNLDARLYAADGVTTLSDARIDSNADLVNVISNNALIQQGIYLADDAGGATVEVGDGTYTESLVIDKSLALKGTGTTNTTILDGVNHTGTGITVNANDVSLNGMIVQNFNHGIAVHSGSISNLSMDDILARNNAYAGFYVGGAASVDGLTVTNSHFDDNNVRIGNTNDFGYGWYIQKNMTPGSTDTVTNVTVTDMTFNGNSQKGIYAEKLDNATFTNVDVINSGTWIDSIFGNAGIDINLKNGNYANILFDNLTISGSGLNSTTKTGYAFTAKARNDGSYAATPASLNGLTIANSDINAGGTYAVALGNNISNASINHSTITGPNAVLFYDGVKNSFISNNTINGTNYGVAISNSNTNIVENNTINSDTFGVSVVNSAAAWIRDNIINNAATGVFGNVAKDIKVSDNEIIGSTVAGVHVTNSPGTGYGGGGNDVDIWSNIINSANGIGVWIQSSNYATVGWHPTNPFATAATGGNTISGGVQGVVIDNSNNAYVAHNDVSNTTSNGIQINGSNAVTVLDNDITNIGWDGIQFNNSTNGLIKDNTITNVTGASGIAAMYGSNGTVIDNNIINGTDRLGIYVWNSNGLQIKNNDINDTGREGGGNWFLSGIHLEGVNNTSVEGNLIRNTAGDAIHVGGQGNQAAQTTSGNVIKNNVIGFTTLAATTSAGADNIKGDGIYVNNSNGAEIKGNTITETHSTGNNIGSGIQLVNSNSAVIGGAGADRNTITHAGWDGIRIYNSDSTTVDNNNINGAERVGIYGENFTNSSIINNIVQNAARYGGIYTYGGGNLIISRNDIDHVSETGILVKNSGLGYTFIQDNNIDFTGEALKSSDGENSGDGIRVVNANGLLATGNKIGLNGAINGTGIFFDPSDYAFIALNTINNVALHGIHSQNNSYVKIQQNTITTTGQHGIFIEGGTDNVVGGPGNGYANAITGTGKDGINVASSNKIELGYNKITTTAGNGISVTTSNNANVHHNTIKKASKAGIKIAGGLAGVYKENTLDGIGNQGFLINGATDGLVLDTNHLNNISWTGIQMDSGKNATIKANDITKTGDDGMRISGTQKVDVLDNVITNTRNGITINGTKNGTVSGNTVTTTKENGIQATGGSNLVVNKNILSGITLNGIKLTNVIKSLIGADFAQDMNTFANRITGAVNGILVTGGEDSRIRGNFVDSSSDTGINVSDVGGTFNEIYFNKVNGGKNGIRVANGTYLVADNRVGLVTGLSGHGIVVDQADGTQVLSNQVSNVAKTGIRINKGSNIEASDNILKNIGNEGIRTEQVKTLTLKRNNLDNVSWSGIQIEGGSNANVERNKINNARGNGIQVSGTNVSTVKDNTVSKIRLNGIVVNDTTGATNVIQGNVVYNTGENGIQSNNAKNLQVLGNFVGFSDKFGTSAGVDNIKGTGIKLSKTNSALIQDNIVDAAKYGIHLSGVANDIDPTLHKTVLLNNTFSSTLDGAMFESGNIDLQGTNIFKFTRDGLVFDGAKVSLVGNTFGTTVLTDTDNVDNTNSYFIRLANGALFNPDQPTILDATQVEFNDDVFTNFVPNSFILPFATYTALENRLFDFDDQNTLGQIFFTFPGGADINDILPQQFLAGMNANAVGSVTILGLPYANGTVPNFANLANIETAAGGEQNTAGDPNALNDIDTAAGGEAQQAQCWNQVYSSLSGTAAPVTYSLDTSPTSLLSAQQSCGTTGI